MSANDPAEACNDATYFYENEKSLPLTSMTTTSAESSKIQTECSQPSLVNSAAASITTTTTKSVATASMTSNYTNEKQKSLDIIDNLEGFVSSNVPVDCIDDLSMEPAPDDAISSSCSSSGIYVEDREDSEEIDVVGDSNERDRKGGFEGLKQRSSDSPVAPSTASGNCGIVASSETSLPDSNLDEERKESLHTKSQEVKATSATDALCLPCLHSVHLIVIDKFQSNDCTADSAHLKVEVIQEKITRIPSIKVSKRSKDHQTGLVFESGSKHFDRHNRLHKERPSRITSVYEHLFKSDGDTEQTFHERCRLLLTDRDGDWGRGDVEMKMVSDEEGGRRGRKRLEELWLDDDDYLRVHLPGYMQRCVRSIVPKHLQCFIFFTQFLTYASHP